MACSSPLPDIAYRRITADAGEAFEGLYAIYKDVFPLSERKPRKRLLAMLNTDAYVFIVGEAAGGVLCFAIARVLEGAGAALLEYMGVRRDHQGQGLGGRTFRGVVGQPSLVDKVLLLEVEDERGLDPVGDEARRKAFYRDLGCREVEGLTYVMPTVADGAPPPMNILTHDSGEASTISKATLKGWLQAIYAQIYGRPQDDPAIAAMLRPLPNEITLA